jgi:hypothetical protein
MNEQQFPEMIEQVRQACAETLETARAVKGDEFADAAGSLFELNQVAYLAIDLAKSVSMSPDLVRMYHEAFCNLIASVGETVLKHLGDADKKEAVDLSCSLIDRFTNLMES